MEKEPTRRQIKVRDELGRGWNRPGIGIIWRNFVLVDSGDGDKLLVDSKNYQATGNLKAINTKGDELNA